MAMAFFQRPLIPLITVMLPLLTLTSSSTQLLSAQFFQPFLVTVPPNILTDLLWLCFLFSCILMCTLLARHITSACLGGYSWLIRSRVVFAFSIAGVQFALHWSPFQKLQPPSSLTCVTVHKGNAWSCTCCILPYKFQVISHICQLMMCSVVFAVLHSLQ